MRVSKRNSVDSLAEVDIQELQVDLSKCGYIGEDLARLRKKLVEALVGNGRTHDDDRSRITAVVDYFQEVKELKSMLKDLEPDISRLLGEDTNYLYNSNTLLLSCLLKVASAW